MGDWRKAALSNKCNGEPSTSLNLALVFDFFNKFCSAFNLSKVTEDELYEAVHANVSYLTGEHFEMKWELHSVLFVLR